MLHIDGGQRVEGQWWPSFGVKKEITENRESYAMMRKLSMVLAILMLGSLFAAAQQSASKIDLFGGYSYFNGGTSGNDGRYSLNGWNGQGTFYLNHWLGATADFGGYYGSPFGVDTHNYSFLFGPTVRIRTTHFTPYVHALFGVDHTWRPLIGGAAITATSFAMAFGGGVDIPVKSHFVVRAAQLDYLYSDQFGNSQNNLRVSTGVVFQFGE